MSEAINKLRKSFADVRNIVIPQMPAFGLSTSAARIVESLDDAEMIVSDLNAEKDKLRYALQLIADLETERALDWMIQATRIADDALAERPDHD